MTRNQKIALGCGGAGCLGLIVVAVAGSLIYFFAYRESRYRAARDYEFNLNVNRSSNTNDDTNANSDSEANSNSDSSSDSSSSSTSAASMSEDDKHRLFQAASMTGDAELIRRVNVKIGLLNDDYTPGDDYQRFVTEHVGWVFRNTDFIQSINTPERARAYVKDHFPE